MAVPKKEISLTHTRIHSHCVQDIFSNLRLCFKTQRTVRMTNAMTTATRKSVILTANPVASSEKSKIIVTNNNWHSNFSWISRITYFKKLIFEMTVTRYVVSEKKMTKNCYSIKFEISLIIVDKSEGDIFVTTGICTCIAGMFAATECWDVRWRIQVTKVSSVVFLRVMWYCDKKVLEVVVWGWDPDHAVIFPRAA